MKRGYIKLYRKITDSWLWKDKPFSYGQAWLDLLMLANHEDKKVLFDKKLITVERGQHLTSEKKLAERWGWGRKKVHKYLELLESDEMLHKDSTKRGTLLTLVKYGFYQDSGTAEEHLRNNSGTSQGAQTINYKNYKNENNIKPFAKKSSFNVHEQNDYDFEMLEKMNSWSRKELNGKEITEC